MRAVQASTLALGYVLRLKRSLVIEQRREAAYLSERAANLAGFFRTPNVFYQKFVSDVDDDSHDCWLTLRQFESELARNGSRPAVFAQADIERSEYRTLEHALSDASRIIDFAIEFHKWDIMRDRFAPLTDCLHESFAVARIHGNNWSPLSPGTGCPQRLKVSLVNRTLLPPAPSPTRATDPIAGLDMPNDRERADCTLSF